MYIWAVYMLPDRNVFITVLKYYICICFYILQEVIEYYSTLGTVAVIGDLIWRVGINDGNKKRRKNMKSK